MGADTVEILSESSLPSQEIEMLSQCIVPVGKPIRFISIGRLLHWKGFYLGIKAFAKADINNAEYWILGDGSEQTALEQLAKDLGVGDRIRFFGRLSREETLARLGEAHVLVHPSLHDSGGWVCLEAMAAARPVLCLDLGGPSVQVDNKTGIKVSACNPEQAVRELAEAMRSLATNQDLRQQMGEAGRNKVKHQFSCEAKGKQFAKLYEQVVG